MVIPVFSGGRGIPRMIDLKMIIGRVGYSREVFGIVRAMLLAQSCGLGKETLNYKGVILLFPIRKSCKTKKS